MVYTDFQNSLFRLRRETRAVFTENPKNLYTMSKPKIPQTPDGRLLNYDAQGRPLAFGAKPSIRYTVDAEPWKCCGYSKKWLPISEFDKTSRPNSKDGYMSVCRECMKKIYDMKSQVKAEVAMKKAKAAMTKAKAAVTKAKSAEFQPKSKEAPSVPSVAVSPQPSSPLSAFDIPSLIRELKSRGVHGTLSWENQETF